MSRIVMSDYNGFSLTIWADAVSGGWKPAAKVLLRLGDALVPKAADVPGVYPTEDAAVDFAIGWVRGQIDGKKIY
jgi:hypothetical protein